MSQDQTDQSLPTTVAAEESVKSDDPTILNEAPVDESTQDVQSAYTRSAERVPWDSRVEVVWLHRFDEGPLVYQAANISESGAALITRGMVHTGTRGIVLVQSRSGRRALRGFEVVHCHYESEIRAHVTGGRWIPVAGEHDRLQVYKDDGIWRIAAIRKRRTL